MAARLPAMRLRACATASSEKIGGSMDDAGGSLGRGLLRT